jgi:hypothetical protein
MLDMKTPEEDDPLADPEPDDHIPDEDDDPDADDEDLAKELGKLSNE